MTTPAAPTNDPLAVPSDGAYFGTHFSATVADRRGAITGLEEQIGRQFAIDHVYHGWDSTFPNEYDRWTIDAGRTLFVSWTTRRNDAPTVKWAEVAAGAYDTLIDERAVALRQLGVPVLVSFDHEPSAQTGSGVDDSGTPEEYRAAWRRVVERFDAVGATNVSWVWTLTAYTFRTSDPNPFYPGDDIVDWVGVDGYANIGCPWLDVPWRSWEEIFGAAHTFATDHDKPLMIAEFSAREDATDADRKASWLRDAIDALRLMPSIKALVSFNSTQSCSSVIASSDAAVEAYAGLGLAPAFGATPGPAAASSAPRP